MSKAIYGLAMPFDSIYWEYEKLTNTIKIETTNRESVSLWKEVVLTINHDHSKTFGSTDDNLFLAINDRGVFFKLYPNDRLGYKAYGEVSRKELRHCSITYIRRFSRDLKIDEHAKGLSDCLGWTENIVVNKHDELLIDEICLTNEPGNKDTFCTTNSKDPRLKGVVWDEGHFFK